MVTKWDAAWTEALEDLFQPVSFGGLHLKNRFVRSATHDYMGNPDGSLSADEFSMYEELAQNQVGLIITGHSYVQHPQGRMRIGQNAIYDDSFVAGYAHLCQKVKAYGSAIALQLNHSGALSVMDSPPSYMRFSSSSTDSLTKSMTHKEISDVVHCFASAARRAQVAGFDAVQIHCAHGYLIDQFLSASTNVRQDLYGPDISNRLRFLQEILYETRKSVGDHYPILLKINCNTAQKKGELPFMKSLLQAIRPFRISVLEISGTDRLSRPAGEHNYYQQPLSEIRTWTDLPLSIAGGIRNISDAVAMRRTGADLISMARPFICQPDFLTILQSSPQTASRCKNCNGCLQSWQKFHKRCVLPP